MKRKILLAVSCGLAVVVSTIWLNTSRLSGDQNAGKAAVVDIAAEGPVTPIVPSSAPLRKQLVELFRERTERMGDDEVRKSLDELTKSIAEQDSAAEMELQKAVAQLKEVLEKFPRTPTAEKAKRALHAIHSKHTKQLPEIKTDVTDKRRRFVESLDEQ
ncbi:MAG: hypothetical protein HY290_33390 [Planctomycetia bacterium]|nr:hypothetical protein [Planctomycetia bacterium]